MKKISILGLHLNYGGVEQAIVNQANALCNDYEVELAITYKLTDIPAFKINPKVKIKYLTNFKPNKKELLDSLKAKRFISFLKEGIKSIKILFAKNSTMKEYIKKSNSDIIISSRITFTKILSKNKKKNVITIAEEHRHHNNNQKYIKKLKKSCRNIDYLIPVSKELTNFYSKVIPNVKCLYIPNCLDFWPIEYSKLNNKNIISIGRLSKEKGFLDLIDVFYLIHEMDNECHLDIIGDGTEMTSIKEKIQKYKLEQNITLHGFKNKEYINNKLLNSSLYLMCSYEESFGIVLIEAGSFNIPAIAFDSAQGANEIIKNNKSGYLIKNRDKKIMANKAIDLINNRDKLLKFGINARNIAKKYSYENIKNEWLNFLKEVE